MRAVKCMLIGTMLCFFFSPSIAQKKRKETQAALLDFVTVSNAYKKFPLYLNVEIKNSTNYILSEEDTSSLDAQFFIRDHGSYVQFGEFEQLVNDSMALLVSNKLQQMILYADAGAVIGQLKAMMGAPLPDSSMKKLADKYVAVSKNVSDDNAEIDLQSKDLLYSTSLPKEVIEMQYDSRTKFPRQVFTMKRTLVPLDSMQYEELGTHRDMAGHLVTAKDNKHFLVREHGITFIYKSIDQSDKKKLPVLFGDRIEKNSEGDYKPVKRYENYYLTLNKSM